MVSGFSVQRSTLGTRPTGLMIAALVTGLVVLLVACGDFYPPSEPFSESEVPGRYVATHGDGREYIELRADSSYVHFFVSNDGEPLSESGPWRLHMRDSGYYSLNFGNLTMPRVRGLDYYDSISPLDPADRPDRIVLTYKKLNGKLRIVVSPTENVQFIKEE